MALIDGLLHWWKLDGDVVDSHAGYDGLFTNGGYGAEKLNDGGRFTNAPASLITLGDNGATKIEDAVFTISGWIRPETHVATRGGVFVDSARGLYYDPSVDKLSFRDNSGAYFLSDAFTLSALQHFAVTLDVAGDLKFYRNGVLAGTHTGVVWPPIGGGTGFWRMGNDGFGNQFVGALDEIGFWDRALTLAEVVELYNLGVGTSLEALAVPETLTAKVAGYARQLADLFPTGRAWSREADAQLTKVRIAIADELARVDDRGVDLIEESDPRTATETLADWERVLRIPDEQILTVPVANADRRVAITSKFTGIRGGQNVEFFERLCLSCGYVVTISRYQDQIFRAGRGRSGDRATGSLWGYVMLVTVNDPPAGPALTHAELEAVVRKHTHSHIRVVFEYV